MKKNASISFISTAFIIMLIILQGCIEVSDKDEYWSNGWSALGDKVDFDVDYFIDMVVDVEKNLYLLPGYGSFIPKWNGEEWSQINASYQVQKICCANGNLYAIIDLSPAPSELWIWNGEEWSALPSIPFSTRLSGSIYAMASDLDGNIMLSSYGFIISGSLNEMVNVIKWNGSNWTEMGGFIDGIITDFHVSSSNEIYIVCDDYPSDYYVARWDGSNWQQLGGTILSQVNDIQSDKYGKVYVALGEEYSYNGAIYSYDGNYWGGTSLSDWEVFTICFDASNNLYAGGKITESYNALGFQKISTGSDMGLGKHSVKGIRKILIIGDYIYVAGDLNLYLGSSGNMVAVKNLKE